MRSSNAKHPYPPDSSVLLQTTSTHFLLFFHHTPSLDPIQFCENLQKFTVLVDLCPEKL